MTELALFAWKTPWVVLAIPFLNALLQWLLVGRFEKGAGILSTLVMAGSVIWGGLLLWGYQQISAEVLSSLSVWQIDWLPITAGFSISIGLMLDSLSLLMVGVVTLISFLIQLYSIGYMKGETGQCRYFAFLNLFTLSMLGLVVAPNLFQTFIFWELVGVSSFLLIGFYYQKDSARAAAGKAFIVTRFADLGFLIGILILCYEAWQYGNHSIDFTTLTEPGFLSYMAHKSTPFAGINLLSLALFALFMGAAGKSAMFPLHIWLPDAMEGPTPVSALIHAATMVVAGVYLVARLYAAYLFDGAVIQVIGAVGAFTIIFAALIGSTQNDIKRVLAYSTLSQIGYMMLALAATSLHQLTLGYQASLFHLFTHAFFKALLFLGAGSIIHGISQNDLRNMGGLRRVMPITHALFLIAVLAITGIPPFSGFYSKDEILLATLHSTHPLYYYVALFGAGLTAFYMFRLYFLAFTQKARSESAKHAHESWIMLIPMLILTLGAIGAGWIPFGSFLDRSALPSHGIVWSVALPALCMAALGISLAGIYVRFWEKEISFLRWGKPLYRLIQNRFYVDEIYLFITRRIIFALVAAPIAWFDRHVVDGMVNLTGRGTRWSGQYLARGQTGQTQTYLVWIILGLILIIFF